MDINVSILMDNYTPTAIPESCEEDKLQGGPVPLSPTSLLVFRCIQIVLLSIGFPLGLVLNTFVIVLVAKVKKLHQTSFYLALQVVVVDLLISLLVFPTTVANLIADRWVFGSVGCPLIGFILFTLRNIRNFLMFVFVTDRLLTVFAPFWYYKRNHRRIVAVTLSIAAWVFAVTFGMIPMPFFLGCHEFSRVAYGCTVSKGCKHPDACDAYKNASIVLSNVIGGFIPLIMYIILYCKARQLKKSTPRLALSSVMTDNFLTDSQKPSTSQNNGRHSSIISATSSVGAQSIKLVEKRRRRDQTANITFALLFVALIGVSFPSTCFFIIGTSAFSARGMPPPEVFLIFTIIFRMFFNFLVIIDPIAIMRNRDVRMVLREGWKKLKSQIRGEINPIQVTSLASSHAKSAVSSELSSISEEGPERKLSNIEGVDSEPSGVASTNARECSVSYEVVVYEANS